MRRGLIIGLLMISIILISGISGCQISAEQKEKIINLIKERYSSLDEYKIMHGYCKEDICMCSLNIIKKPDKVRSVHIPEQCAENFFNSGEIIGDRIFDFNNYYRYEIVDGQYTTVGNWYEGDGEDVLVIVNKWYGESKEGLPSRINLTNCYIKKESNLILCWVEGTKHYVKKRASCNIGEAKIAEGFGKEEGRFITLIQHEKTEIKFVEEEESRGEALYVFDLFVPEELEDYFKNYVKIRVYFKADDLLPLKEVNFYKNGETNTFVTTFYKDVALDDFEPIEGIPIDEQGAFEEEHLCD